jgi:sialate O-acetylesterase
MIQSWRTAWGYDFPFLFVQLAPFKKIVDQPQPSEWAELREAQFLTTQKLAHTAMAVITDTTDPATDQADIHPKNKAPVGERLALAARQKVYGEKIVGTGPVYESVKFEGNRAILSFTSIGSGLTVKDEKLTGFTVAGKDQKFVNAEATVEGNSVVVSSPEVKEPIAVRFGWADYPVVNLFNKEGIPATPFRTDDWQAAKTAKVR